MIYTTYFAQLRNLPSNVIPISICRFPPKWYHGMEYLKLAPPWSILKRWKDGEKDYNAVREYVQDYYRQVLNPLSIPRVLNDLQIMLPNDIKLKIQSPVWNDDGWHIALICYEKPGDFCHRKIVAEWLQDAGITCQEWKKE